MFRLVVVHRAPIVRIASYSCSALKILTTGITSANCPLRKPCETCETLRNEKPFCESLQNFYLRKLAKSFAKACEPVVKLRNCDLGGESGTISLLSVKFLFVANDVLFRLSFAKVEEMEKTFRDIVISDADILSFRDCLESDLKRKNMWEHLKSGKLHTILCS